MKLDVRLARINQAIWPELIEELGVGRLIELGPDALKIGIAEAGLDNGRAAVSIRVDLPDGRVAIVQNAGENFIRLAHAIHSVDNELSKPPDKEEP